MRLFRRRNKFNITVEQKLESSGIHIMLKNQGKFIGLPIRLTVSELKQLKNLDQLQLLEDLLFDGKMNEIRKGEYILPYEEIYQLTSDDRNLLDLPDQSSQTTIKLNHISYIGNPNFKFTPEIHSDKYKNLHKIGTRKGAIIELDTKERILLEEENYLFLEKLSQQPSPNNIDELSYFFAEVRKMALDLGIPINKYIEKEDYEFINKVDIEVDRSENGIEFYPNYKHDLLEQEVLEEINKSNRGYVKHQNKRVFVKKEAQHKKEKILNLEPIKDKDIPMFVQNPEAFIPEDLDDLLENFSERVKKLGIRVYRAQPYIHAHENDRGWFDYETGFEIKDSEGNKISQEEESFFSDTDDSFKKLDQNTYIEIPDQAKEFSDLTTNIKKEIKNTAKQDSAQPNLSNYMIEIFENFTHVEYNKPLQDMRSAMLDEDVFEVQPPNSFKATLKPFQEDGFKWMKTLRFMGSGGLLADDMGLGKTIQVIAYLSYLKDLGKLNPTLLVLPKTLIQNWINEMGKFAPTLLENYYVHIGPNRSKDPSLIGRYEIVLTTYQTLARDQIDMGRVDWELVVCDEAQAIKNPTTATSVVVKALKNKGRIALTGTPVENNLTELWSIVDFVQPGALGSLNSFKEEYELNTTDQDEDMYDEIQKSIEKKIKHIYLRRTKEGELKNQLPQKQEYKKYVSMGREQQDLYSDIVKQVNEKQMSGLNAINQLRKLCSHPGLIDTGLKVINPRRVPKLLKTLHILNSVQEKNEKAIIFTEYRAMQTILKREILKKFNLDVKIINGLSVHRQQMVDKFNNSTGFNILILSPRAAGTGLTITGANHVIHYTRWWNPAVENQATDRVYRIGQEKDVHVYLPIVIDDQKGDTIEKILDDLIEEKKSLASNVIVPSKGQNMQEEVLRKMPGFVH